MDVFKSKPLKLASAAFYIVLMFLSFYCACYRLPVGLKYAINLLIFGWACAMFFLRPMFNRAIFCLRFFALFFFPYLMFWMWSVAIWITEFQSFNYILRGSLNIFYMLTNLMFASAAVYLFGEATMPLTLVGMTIANGLVALQVAARAGIGTFISEYIRLLVTFADDTGGAMHQMELHDMVYGWGVMVIYYAIHKEKNHKTQAVCFLISALFFTLGFKRIAVPAVFCAAVMYHILCKWRPRHLQLLTDVIALVAGGCIFFYLWMIKSGLFVELANEFGVDLMYRDILYEYFSQFFELLPTYMGRGIRFIYTYATEDPSYPLATAATHNVYLELYLEVGFWCWWIWILFELAFRIHRVEERYTEIPAYALMAMNLYVFFTYLTDNTSFYYPINVLYRMAIMVWCLEVSENSDLLDSETQPLAAVKESRQKKRNKKREEENVEGDFHICV